VEVQAYLDMAFDYANAGMWEEACDVLSRLDDTRDPEAPVYPTVLYALGYLRHRQGRDGEAHALYARASRQPTDYCFPVRLEELAILEHARSIRPDDGRIAYYLGNLFYDKKRYDEAMAKWKLATRATPEFSIPWRNLGIAYYNVRHDADEAIRSYERAFAARPQDGRVLSELDQLLQRSGVPAERRLARLEAHMELVRARDDLSTELATLYNRIGAPQKALDYIASRRFHPWEGGTGSVLLQYVTAHLLCAQAALDEGDAEASLAHLAAARDYPENLGERKHLLWPDTHLDYYAGLAYQALGERERATTSFESVLVARADLSPMTYYRALAIRALGRDGEAEAVLQDMLNKATRKQGEEAERGYATSVPEFVFAEADLETRRRTHYTYLIGLAHLGLGHAAEAKAAFREVLDRDPGHLEAALRLRRVASGRLDG
jgi:tetratricopeptide (TPR) repeat protein